MSLQVTISERLADDILDLIRDAIEASQGIDDETERDLERFQESITKAKRRNKKKELLNRIRQTVQL